MQLRHEFTLPIAPEQAWDTLLDVPRVARCMPGATLDRADGDEFSGRVTLKIGPLKMAYRGDIRITERDERLHRLVLKGTGKEAGGSGTAEATVTAGLRPDTEGTVVTLDTELALTGRAAQFGRALVSDVAGTIIGQFSERLAREMRDGDHGARELPPVPAGSTKDDSLDVLALAKPLLASRTGVAIAALVAIALGYALGRRRSGGR